jgi:uncharacterized protein YcfL
MKAAITKATTPVKLYQLTSADFKVYYSFIWYDHWPLMLQNKKQANAAVIYTLSEAVFFKNWIWHHNKIKAIIKPIKKEK